MRFRNKDLQLSRVSIALISLIIFSSLCMRHVLLWVSSLIGHTIVGIIIILTIIAITCVCVFLTFRVYEISTKGMVLILLLFLGAAVTMLIRIPEEKIHIIEFGLLGWFLMRDILNNNGKIQNVSTALSACFFFCIADEVLQGILPYRDFDVRDIIFNLAGSIWGISLFLIHRE